MEEVEEVQDYKGYKISLLGRTRDDGKWSCTYCATKSGESESATGFSGDKIADTWDEAKSKALTEARSRIDSPN